MPAQSSITISDGAATPVAHVFTPDGALAQPNGKVVAEWVDRSPGVKAGYWKITEQFSPSNPNGIEKQRFVIDRATLETLSNNTSTGVNPAPQKAYSTLGVIEVWYHDRSSEAERADIAALVKNFTATTFFTDKVKKAERSW